MGHRHRGGIGRIEQLLEQTQRWLGENNEKRVLAAYTTDHPWPKRIPWMLDVRRRNGEEDAEGIDIIFVTDVGEIYVQVKSSEDAREDFVERQVGGDIRADIIPVYISPSFDSLTICRIVTPLVASERRIRLRNSVPTEL